LKTIKLNTDFLDLLPADPIIDNYPRQVSEACYSFAEPTPPKKPELIHFSDEVLSLLGFDEKQDVEWLTKIVSGQSIYPNTKPYAMCYGGHQFGNWAGQLGDGRAINLFTLENNQQRFNLQLKGAGPTPYSRTADGYAVLRSSIREHLCSEAMHYLRVPTSRSLSLSLTGNEVLRDVLYDGNPAYEKGAIVCRVAESFLRFGNYEIFAARGDKENLQKLVDFTISNHFPHIQSTGKEAVIEFFREVAERTITLIFEWQRVGFVHGVMNTDNMSILGLTIDYGPYGWLENFDPLWTPNTTDKANRRYRYGGQPNIGLWNLVKLANTLYFLIDEAKPFEEILELHQSKLRSRMQHMILEKLGLYTTSNDTLALIDPLILLLQEGEFDYTLFFRELSESNSSIDELIKATSYLSDSFSEQLKQRFTEWMNQYSKAIEIENQPEYNHWYAKRPFWAKHKVGSSMLSCSS